MARARRMSRWRMSKSGSGIDPLVRERSVSDKRAMGAKRAIEGAVNAVLDFALPPRCAGCGTIVDQVHSFCADCWRQIDFLVGGCACCGLPLQATEAERCAACLASPPRVDRMRAVVAYDQRSRDIPLRLKYGRKVALAKMMAKYMAPLIEGNGADSLLVPVPLHRSRLWQRGFNQAAIVARELASRTGISADVTSLKRVKRTPPLKGMTPLQRRKAVASAFASGDDVRGKRVILVDDVLTTGSTANACARVLKRAGASRVELVTWARVVRPAQFVR
jgi:ComF family protein